MSRTVLQLFGAVYLFTSSLGATANPEPTLPYAADHVLIKFRSEAQTRLAAGSITNVLGDLLQQLNLPPGGELTEPAVSRLLRERRKALNATVTGSTVDLGRFLYLRLPPTLSVEQCVKRLAGHPLVEYVEPDWVGTAGPNIPSDPIFANQWHHQNSAKPTACIQTPAAWDLTLGSANILVAVLDTGLNADLDEFTNRVVAGYNFAYDTSDTTDDNNHGTAVAGTLAANANNTILGVGVDWQCRILPIKVLDQNNSGYYSWWAQGVDYAVSLGAKVINLSAGGFSNGTTLTQTILNAIAQGVIFVTITHNDSVGTIRFPGNLTNCITVGACDEQDLRCTFSNYGPQIDLVAPGININTVGPGDAWWLWEGTSFAAPQVSGVCSLLLSLRPDLNQTQARNILCLAAEDGVGDATDTPGFDNYFGWGRLNAFGSLLLAQTRIDQTKVLDNGQLQISWRSPANASNKEPYLVSFTSDLNQHWTTVSNGFAYTPTRTTWVDDSIPAPLNSSPRFYRLSLRVLP